MKRTHANTLPLREALCRLTDYQIRENKNNVVHEPESASSPTELSTNVSVVLLHGNAVENLQNEYVCHIRHTKLIACRHTNARICIQACVYMYTIKGQMVTYLYPILLNEFIREQIDNEI